MPTSIFKDGQIVRKLKVHRLGLSTTIAGLSALLAFYILPSKYALGFLQDLGATLIIAGVIVLTYEYAVRKESETNIERVVAQTIEKKLQSEWQALEEEFQKHLAETLLMNEEVQRQLLGAHSEKIPEIIQSCLRVKLGSEPAEQLYDSLISPILKKFELGTQRILENYDCEINMSNRESDSSDNPFFNLQLVIEYVFRLNTPIIKFGITNSREKFKLGRADPAQFFTHFISPLKLSKDKLNSDFFQVSNLEIQKLEYPLEEVIVEKIREGPSDNGEIYNVEWEVTNKHQTVGKKVKITYTLDTIVSKKGGNYFLKMTDPTKNFKALFDSGEDTNIDYVGVSDQFVTSGIALVKFNRIGSRIQRIVSVDGWIFPNSGVTFSWSTKK